MAGTAVTSWSGEAFPFGCDVNYLRRHPVPAVGTDLDPRLKSSKQFAAKQAPCA
jgi:hypothetical protein